MAWLRFLADYEYRQPNFTIDYKAGMTCNVTRNCATLAVAAGRADVVKKSRKESTKWSNDLAAEASTQK